MNIALLMNWRLWGATAIALLLWGTHWKAYTLGEINVQAQWAQAREVTSLAITQAEIAARDQEQAWNDQQTKERKDAIARETKIRADADGAHAAVDSLRTQLADTARRIAQGSPAACIDTGTTLTELLAQCADQYTNLAATTDRHVSDIKTLIGSWPKGPTH